MTIKNIDVGSAVSIAYPFTNELGRNSLHSYFSPSNVKYVYLVIWASSIMLLININNDINCPLNVFIVRKRPTVNTL